MSPWSDNGDRTAVLSQRVPVLEGAALRTIQISTERPLCNSMSAARERYNAATRGQTGHCLGDPVTFHFAVAGALAMTRSTAMARKEVPIVRKDAQQRIKAFSGLVDQLSDGAQRVGHR